MFTQELADIICNQLAEGKSLRTICAAEGMPTEGAVRYWVVSEDIAPGFASQYTRARSVGLECINEGILDISDDQSEDPNSRRVRIDARKWFLSKMRPDKYSDRLAITGAKDAEPMRVLVEYSDKIIPE